MAVDEITSGPWRIQVHQVWIPARYPSWAAMEADLPQELRGAITLNEEALRGKLMRFVNIRHRSWWEKLKIRARWMARRWR